MVLAFNHIYAILYIIYSFFLHALHTLRKKYTLKDTVMKIDPRAQQQIIHILTNIFPGVFIYYYGSKEHEGDIDGKQPELDIALDLGRKIGTVDLSAAQQALSQTHIPYTIYLYDLNSVSEVERKNIIAKAEAWKLEPFA
jgi:hypothetical protein